MSCRANVLIFVVAMPNQRKRTTKVSMAQYGDVVALHEGGRHRQGELIP
jgi:hypothetical protein